MHVQIINTMVDLFHELHPNGDVIFVVYKPDNEFAEWDKPEHSYWPTDLSKSPSVKGPPFLSSSSHTGYSETYESSDSETDGTAENLDTSLEGCEEISNPSSPETHTPLTAANTPANQLSRKTGQDNTPPHSDAVSEPLEGTERVVMRIQASTIHLIPASDYFATMFTSHWKETTALGSGKPCILTVREWDLDAFVILMNIIHGHNDEVPRCIKLEMLAKIAVLVDYYKCLPTVKPFWLTWAPKLPIPACYSRDLILWLWASWAFCEEDKFRTVSTIVVETSRGPIRTLGLPIPESVISKCASAVI